MIGSWLTTRAVYIFGAVLILVGLIFIGSGVPIVRLEIGWTEIIGGSVAASAGCIIVVLGLFLARLEQFQETLDRLAIAAGPRSGLKAAMAAAEAETEVEIPVPEPVRSPVLHPLSPGAWRSRVDSDVRPEPALAVAPSDLDSRETVRIDPPEAPALTESAPALMHAEEQASHSPPVEPFEQAEPVKPRSNFMSSILARRMMTTSMRRDPEGDARPAAAEPVLPSQPAALPPLRPSVVDLAPGWDEVPEQEDTGSPEPETVQPLLAEASVDTHPVNGEAHTSPVSAPGLDTPAESPTAVHTPPAEPPPVQPVVVGRYNAGSASYVMYSNGMIEVETEQGTHQFASMQELKAFIERRDTASAY